MSKHTPGPWKTHIPSHIDLTICDMAGISAAVVWDKETDRDICYIPPRNSEHAASDCEEATANSLLIAAAPDLLEALQALLAEFDRYSDVMADIGKGHEDYGLQRDTARALILRLKNPTA